MRPLQPDQFQPLLTPAALLAGRRDGALRIRHARENDLPEIHRLDREAFPDAAYPYFTLRQLYDLFDDFLLVVEDADGHVLVGYILACPKPGGESCWLHSLVVTAGLRGQGLGRRLLGEALGLLRAADVREARLTVDPDNTTALALYKSLGFTPDPEGPYTDYYGPGENRMTMTLHLR
ncbi:MULTISPECIES: N-acetyltransferase [unclassified Streptomyces]|uniref:GNAT family N-acetyltransferase n=1 Tax=unclassified Streptomyces TaxID=2593676 RepID=UPI0033A391FD